MMQIFVVHPSRWLRVSRERESEKRGAVVGPRLQFSARARCSWGQTRKAKDLLNGAAPSARRLYTGANRY